MDREGWLSVKVCERVDIYIWSMRKRQTSGLQDAGVCRFPLVFGCLLYSNPHRFLHPHPPDATELEVTKVSRHTCWTFSVRFQYFLMILR